MGVTPGPWTVTELDYADGCIGPDGLEANGKSIADFSTPGENWLYEHTDIWPEFKDNVQFIVAACNAFHHAAQSLGVDPLELAKRLESGGLDKALDYFVTQIDPGFLDEFDRPAWETIHGLLYPQG